MYESANASSVLTNLCRIVDAAVDWPKLRAVLAGFSAVRQTFRLGVLAVVKLQVGSGNCTPRGAKRRCCHTPRSTQRCSASDC